jgi:general secretion pathway protein F
VQAISQTCTAVDAGKPIAAALRAVQLGDEISLRLVAAGENAGDLGTALTAAADHFSRRFERRVDRLTRLIEPLLLIAVGATIGLIVLLMYMPIFDLASGLQN